MKTRNVSVKSAAVAAVFCMGLWIAPAAAQTKPAASTSKVKRVLLYNKIGDWVHDAGIADVKSVMGKLAAAKGFQLTQLDNDASISLTFLKQFQVIVWNNNTDGQASVPSATARTAIIEYVKQGGGWFLIHGAGDHKGRWAELTAALGSTFFRHGDQGRAEAVIDNAAKAHRELKFMVADIPATFQLTDEWYTFQATVRPLPGVTVVATSRPVAGANGVIVPIPDNSNDLTYIWARQGSPQVGQGRMIYNAIGHGQNQLMAQVDSIVPKLYWENLRYAAGDYQYGCLNRAAPNYDSLARVDDGTCVTPLGVTGGAGRYGTEITVVGSGLQTRLRFPHEDRFSVELRDTRGALVWSRNLENTSEIRLDDAIRPGIYHLVATAGRNVLRHRLTVL